MKRVNDSMSLYNQIGFNIPIIPTVAKLLPSSEYFIFACVLAFNRAGHDCYASNNYFAELLGLKINSVQKIIKKLEDKGLINRVTQVTPTGSTKRTLSVDFDLLEKMLIADMDSSSTDVDEITPHTIDEIIPYKKQYHKKNIGSRFIDFNNLQSKPTEEESLAEKLLSDIKAIPEGAIVELSDGTESTKVGKGLLRDKKHYSAIELARMRLHQGITILNHRPAEQTQNDATKGFLEQYHSYIDRLKSSPYELSKIRL
jgi:Mn-dependent DtxR family transcriptional regulator